MSHRAPVRAAATDLHLPDDPAVTRTTQALLWSVILFELSPAGHAVRLAALAWSQVTFTGPVPGALAYGGSTFAIETAAALAAAVLATNRPRSPRRHVAQRVDRITSQLAGRGPLPPVAMTGIAVFGGSAVAIWAQLLDSVPRGRTDLRRFGLLVALGLGLLSAVQGALLGQGIAAPGPVTVAGAAAAVGITPVLARVAARRRGSATASPWPHAAVDGAAP